VIKIPYTLGDKVANDHTDEELREVAMDLESAVTIPVNIELDLDHRVLDLSELKNILVKAEKLAIQECQCRLSRKNCDSPLETCITINPSDDWVEKYPEYHPRFISIDEALEAMKKSHEAGLVHLAYTMKGTDHIHHVCSCCPCCCSTLGGLIRHGISTTVLTSRLIAEDEESKCINCGKCVDRCVFGARWLEDGKKNYYKEKCFGCGLCVSTCPSNAINLIDRDQRKINEE
jgi:Pyruvate/2-oxoacid:ferredoxin oxidoreductase delta subunit